MKRRKPVPTWDAVWSDGNGMHIIVMRGRARYALYIHDERSPIPIADSAALATFYTEQGARKFVSAFDKLTKYRRIGSV